MKPLLIAVVLLAVSVPAAVAVAAMQRPTLSGDATPSAAAERRAVSRILRRDQFVSCGGGRGDAVALTFDDGPSPYTPQVLADLRAAGAQATFFVVGNRLQYWPEAVREEMLLGEVGDHTWSHPALTWLPHWLVWLELMRTQYAVEQVAGRKPALFRTPYALHSRATDEVVHRLGMVEVFWDVDSGDDVPNARAADVVRNVVRRLRPGAIVIMHDMHPWTVRALPRILHAVAARGLRAVSVSELLALDPPAPHQRCPYAPVGGGA